MKKQEYMEQLSRALSCFSENTQKEVLEDYEDHFTMGLENGKTEEEICLELGSIDNFIEELSTMEKAVPKSSQNAQNTLSSQAPLTSSSETQENKQYHSKTGKNLVLDGLNADVFFAPSNDEQFHIRYTNNGNLNRQMMYHFYFREEGHTIYTGVRKSKTSIAFWQNFGNCSIALNVEIPKDMKKIHAKTTSGDIHFNDLFVPDVQLSAASGDLTCNNNTIESFCVNTASGDITCSNNTASDFMTNTASGDVTYNNNITKSYSINTASGDITCCNETSSSLSVNTASGDIECKNLVAEKAKYNTASGDLEINGTFAFCEAGSASGDLEIFSNACASIHLNSVSGDIDLTAPHGVNGNIHTISGDTNLSFGNCPTGLDISFQAFSGTCNIHRNGFHQTLSKKGHAVIPGEGVCTLQISSTSGETNIR